MFHANHIFIIFSDQWKATVPTLICTIPDLENILLNSKDNCSDVRTTDLFGYVHWSFRATLSSRGTQATTSVNDGACIDTGKNIGTAASGGRIGKVKWRQIEGKARCHWAIHNMYMLPMLTFHDGASIFCVYHMFAQLIVIVSTVTATCWHAIWKTKLYCASRIPAFGAFSCWPSGKFSRRNFFVCLIFTFGNDSYTIQLNNKLWNSMDSGFHTVVDSGFQANADSGFQSVDSGFQQQKFAGFRIPDSLTWGDILVHFTHRLNRFPGETGATLRSRVVCTRQTKKQTNSAQHLATLLTACDGLFELLPS